MKAKLIFLFSFIFWVTYAQFPGPAGTIGTTAMYTDSSAFVAWGTNCHVNRGLMDVSTPSLGLASVGDSSMALGKAGINGVVSLGDGGYAIVTFSTPIKNGTGYDFAVFENAFNDTYLELGFVEVSSDGINYFRFPATSNSLITPQYSGSAIMDATKLNNLAGKYRALYGTPFDLQEMTGISQLNVNAITHVKIIDVVGSINPLYGTYDKNNNIINDPWTTPYPSSGFDLDAVGVINQAAVGIHELSYHNNFKIYPNPANSVFNISSALTSLAELKILNAQGIEVKQQSLVNNNVTEVNISDLSCGVYFLYLYEDNYKTVYKLIKE